MAFLFTFVIVSRKKEKARNNGYAALDDRSHIFGFGTDMQVMVAPELTALWTSIYLQNRYSNCNPIAWYLPVYGV